MLFIPKIIYFLFCIIFEWFFQKIMLKLKIILQNYLQIRKCLYPKMPHSCFAVIIYPHSKLQNRSRLQGFSEKGFDRMQII